MYINLAVRVQVSVFLQVQQECEIKYPGLLDMVTQHVVARLGSEGCQDSQQDRGRLLTNLLTICTWERDHNGSLQDCVRYLHTIIMYMSLVCMREI